VQCFQAIAGACDGGRDDESGGAAQISGGGGGGGKRNSSAYTIGDASVGIGDGGDTA
jgi:hypothetical protein